MSTDSHKEFFCELCSLRFDTHIVFNFHESLVHPNKCHICDKIRSSKYKKENGYTIVKFVKKAFQIIHIYN